jgi:hypothetical protein
LCVKRVKAFEALRQNLLIGQTLLGPALEDLFHAEAFDPVKLLIFQIGVMDELSDSQNRSIPDTESFDQRFESAMIRVMAEFHLKHIVRDSLRNRGGRVSKDKFGI